MSTHGMVCLRELTNPMLKRFVMSNSCLDMKMTFNKIIALFVAGIFSLLNVAQVCANDSIVADTLQSAMMSPAHQSVGLVLSGGGAKGIAHIGVIQALEDNNIPIDFVAGTSMGAIVGGLYAIGYTPAEMLDLLLSRDFANWSTGQIDPNLTYYFLKQPQTPAFAHLDVNLHKNDSVAESSSMPSSLISPLPMNFAFMDLFASYTAQCGGDFDKLFVPFRCVASDVVHKHKIVCRGGELSDAIRASMSFPAVFEPIKMNGVYVYDGGIYDNFPVDVMREDFAPSIMIGVDVHSEETTPSNGIVSQLENMIIQNNDYSLPADEGVRIHVDVSKFSLLDFNKANEIYAIGYARAMEMMDSIQGRVTSRVPTEARKLRRRVFKSASPYVRFDSVNVVGGTAMQNEYLSHIFESARHKTDTFGIDKARLAYYRAITPGRLRNLFPQAEYNDTTGLFTLNLAANVKDNFSLGAGGYLSSSNNSMIFLSADYSSMSFTSWNTRLMGWLGQSYMAAQFDGRLLMSNDTPSAVEFTAVVSRKKYYESDKLFYQDNSPAFISRQEAFVRADYAWALGRRAKAFVGVGYGTSRNKFYSNEFVEFMDSNRENTHMSLGQAIGSLEYCTLDNMSYPMSGSFLNVTAMQTLGNYHQKRYDVDDSSSSYSHRQHWFQAEVKASKYILMGSNFSLGIDADVLVSNRKLLNTYYSSLVNAPSFTPSPTMENVFNKAFHANSFAAVGVSPIWSPFQRAQVRLAADVFMPFRRINLAADGVSACYGGWFRSPEFSAEMSLVYNLPFASICGYVNYLSYPARNWSVGLSFGLNFTASRFLR